MHFPACRSCSSIWPAHRRAVDGRPDCENWSVPAPVSNLGPCAGSSRRSASRSTRSTARARPVELPTTTGKTLEKKRRSDGHCLACRVTLRPEEGAPAEGGRVHVAGQAVAAALCGENPADGSFVDGGFLTGDFGRFDADRQPGADRPRLGLHQRRRAKGPARGGRAGLACDAGCRATCVSWARADAARGQQIVACIVAAGWPADMLAVRQYCAARLAAYKVPRQIVWLDRIPLTARGKTRSRASCEALVARRARPEGAEIGML